MWGKIIFAIVILLVVLIARHCYTLSTKDNVFREYIYLDNNSTTEPHPQVIKHMNTSWHYGNASSTVSAAAREVLLRAKLRIANTLQLSPDREWEVVFTSGASESNNLFIRGVVEAYWERHPGGAPPNIILGGVEHKTSIECAKSLAVGRAEVTFIPPRIDGTINPMDIGYAIQPNTIAVSVMHVNNETGAINDITTIAEITRAKGIPLHTDITQSFGKLTPVEQPPQADAYSISFHKMHGPPGVGALVMSDRVVITSQIAGAQNNGLRGGTENIPGIAGALRAMEITHRDRVYKNAHLLSMKNQLIKFLTENAEVRLFSDFIPPTKPSNHPYSVVFLGPVGFDGLPDPARTSPGTLLVSFVKNYSDQPHFCNIRLKNDLLESGVVVSIGSACNTDPSSPSHVLMAMKAPFIIRCGVVRISLGDYNTHQDITRFCNKLIKCLNQQTARVK